MAKIEDALKESKLEKAINKQNKMIQPLLDTQNRINKMMVQPALESQERLNEITEPFRETQKLGSRFQTQLGLASQFENIGLQLSTNFLKDYNFSAISETMRQTQAQLVATLGAQFQIQNPLNGIPHFLEEYSNQLKELVRYPIIEYQNSISAIMTSWLENVTGPFQRLLQGLNSPFNFKAFEKRYLELMYENRWFPYVNEELSLSFMGELLDIKRNTRTEKSRIKKVDAYIFSTFHKTKLTAIKREWRTLDNNKTRCRILREAVDAHINRKYALSTFALVPMWEDIIKQKSNIKGRADSNAVKNAFSNLVSESELPKIVSGFYDDYIMYQCDSISDVKEDVPGRHSTSHGWITRYPTRKTSLNAILFTDFLLRLNYYEEDTTP